MSRDHITVAAFAQKSLNHTNHTVIIEKKIYIVRYIFNL